MPEPSNGLPTGAPLHPLQVAGYQPPAPGDSSEESARDASARLRALAALSGSLTDALDPEQAAVLVEQKALSALGSTSAVVVTLGTFPPTLSNGTQALSQDEAKLHVVHAIGLPAEVKAALDALPLDAPVPFAEVARIGEPLFLDSESELRRYPDWGAAMIHAGARAAAIVPVWANGELRGVLGLAWARPHTFDEDERAFVLTLGVMCAQAIMRSHLKESERVAREAAEHANSSKAHFLATVSHELRTPMNSVIGYTELLADEFYGPVSAIQKDHLGRVRASATHLLELIEDLLSFARIEAGEEVVRANTALLDDIVEQSLVLVRPLALRKGLDIRVDGPGRPVELHTDRRKVCQILVNLLANAVKFSDAGDVILRLGVAGTEPDVEVRFEVTDSGHGIAHEDHERIFDPFWQEDPASPHAPGGTGLGLSVARQFARLLGGDVVLARSARGEGSTFVVTLPARYPDRALAAGAPSSARDQNRRIVQPPARLVPLIAPA